MLMAAFISVVRSDVRYSLHSPLVPDFPGRVSGAGPWMHVLANTKRKTATGHVEHLLANNETIPAQPAADAIEPGDATVYWHHVGDAYDDIRRVDVDLAIETMSLARGQIRFGLE